MHLSPTKLEECYRFLTVPHIATWHIVGAQEELTTLKGELSPIRKKDSNLTLQVQPPQKNKQNQKSPPHGNQVFLSGVGMKPAYTFPELCNH